MGRGQIVPVYECGAIMKLYIKIQDGKPVDHPILEENLLLAFPNIDVNNLPEGFIRFERIKAPAVGPYEKNQQLKYEIQSDGVCRDVWFCEPMTAEEILDKQNSVKTLWQERTIYKSWVFNEETCNFEPPVPPPSGDDKTYVWNELKMKWEEIVLPHSHLEVDKRGLP